MPPNAFFILPLLYFLTVLAVVSLLVIAVWRIMKAQESAARAFQEIAATLAQRPLPPQ